MGESVDVSAAGGDGSRLAVRVVGVLTRPGIADDYESYIKTEGIPPLEKTALGVQLFREDREHESWFTTISYWPDLDAMTAFTKGEPTKVHHLDRDAEFLIELPEFIQIHRILINRQGLR